jgi:hypothetical protein
MAFTFNPTPSGGSDPLVERDDVAGLEVLEFGDDARGAGPPEVVEQVVVVPAGLAEAELHDPGPDQGRWRLHGDGPGGVEGGAGDELVSRHRSVNLVIGRAPSKLPGADHLQVDADADAHDRQCS